MKSSKLFRRDFTIMILGQIMSLFGNAILRFTLSLHVLDLTGSAAVFGSILALSTVPTVLFSPVGGVVADRFPRQRIMYVLDFSTAALVLIYLLFFFWQGGVVAAGAVMFLLAVIQALYQPSVVSSIPLLCAQDQLMAANGVAAQVQALSTLLGPILGAVLKSTLGAGPLLAAGALCFFLSAVLELFLHIPFVRRPSAAPFRQARQDLGEAFRFLLREKPYLLHFLLVLAGVNFFLSALFTVGLPFLIKTYLGLSDLLYSFSEGALGLGSILGGLFAGVAARVPMRNSHRFLMATSAMVAPMVLVLAFSMPPMGIWAVITLCAVLGMAFAVLFNIFAQTYLQQQTPAPLLGKVSSLDSAVCVCALPLGQAVYGALFQILSGAVWLVLLFGLVSSLLMALSLGRLFRRLGDEASGVLQPGQ
ncbi:enterobactin exporter EntS [uncultured Flavonifractor sp.]|nr:enterobactin exporter EntS [uncultured Flavonifractor sp.]